MEYRPDIQAMDDEDLLDRQSELKDYLTPNGNKWEELTELLEIERELTLREH